MGAKKVLKGILEEGAKRILWVRITIHILLSTLSLYLSFLVILVIIDLHKEWDFGIHLFCP